MLGLICLHSIMRLKTTKATAPTVALDNFEVPNVHSDNLV